MRTAGLLVVALLACAPATAVAHPDPSDPGQTSTGTVVSSAHEYRYLLYTPAAYEPGHAVPLVVMVHGCQTTADQEMHVTLFNKLAEREDFAVLYPDVDVLGRAEPGPLANCWQFAYPPTYFRGNSDAAAIATMTRTAMNRLAIDPERVYIVGVSAGGLMTSIEAAAYADLYAAAGIVESAGYADGPCFTTGVGIPVQASALLARVAMGSHARVVPRLVIGSTGDLAFPAHCADKALVQSLRTSNLVLSGGQTAPLALTPSATRYEQMPGGYPYRVSSYRDPAGCLIGERWIIDGMPHKWPGGAASGFGGYGDPKAPDGATAAWDFLRRYTKSGTAMPCAEASR